MCEAANIFRHSFSQPPVINQHEPLTRGILLELESCGVISLQSLNHIYVDQFVEITIRRELKKTINLC